LVLVVGFGIGLVSLVRGDDGATAGRGPAPSAQSSTAPTSPESSSLADRFPGDLYDALPTQAEAPQGWTVFSALHDRPVRPMDHSGTTYDPNTCALPYFPSELPFIDIVHQRYEQQDAPGILVSVLRGPMSDAIDMSKTKAWVQTCQHFTATDKGDDGQDTVTNFTITSSDAPATTAQASVGFLRDNGQGSQDLSYMAQFRHVTVVMQVASGYSDQAKDFAAKMFTKLVNNLNAL
jgi:hypothetical protein